MKTWLRAFILAIFTGELMAYMMATYLPGLPLQFHITIGITAFTLMYAMAPRSKDIRSAFNEAYSIHRVDKSTMLTETRECSAKDLQSGEMIILRSRLTGQAHYMETQTPFFVVTHEPKGDFIKVSPWKSMEIIA